ncbi:S-adenosyl-L-methionine-dependent methyltransferase [Sporodiniella umbellata]|nr:S-adenosyl-L-methionine-dependent methyltransferase [Sporodiniella umbellata]
MLRILRPAERFSIRFSRHYSESLTPKIKKEPFSPLSKHLHDSIKITGPMTLAHYMRQVLVNPLSGYYMGGDVFGKKGDFVTSPEISQVFGELCGIWYLTEWIRLGKPEKTQIIEFGPGRGTLMCDMLRSLSHFPHFYKTITDVHLIEASMGLRKMQRAALVNGSHDEDVTRFKGSEKEAAYETITREDGVKISWYDGIEVIPDQWSFVMAHEFFDALPIHTLEKEESEWKEMLVDMDDSDESEHNFRLVKSALPTAVTKAYMEDERFKTYSKGERVEISPDSWGLIEKIAKYLEKNGGAGLAIDYGQDYTQGHTLRAIKEHKIIHPMSDPGTADLSADVDFSFLKEVIKERSEITAHGPITQSKFLQALGIQARVEALFRNAKSKESRIAIMDGAERLMDPEAMGRIYKVLAFSNDTRSVTQGKPVGFEM